jgi:hypothetical protein
MGRIVVSQFVTLDGVFEDPGGARDSTAATGHSGSTGGRREPEWNNST